MKKELSTFALFWITVITFLVAFVIGGQFGATFSLVGMIFLVMTVINFIRNLGKDKPAGDVEDAQE